MRRSVLAIAVLLPSVLAACGSARDLRPPKGEPLPVAPYGATEAPNSTALLTPGAQARPQPSDELLKNSEERRSDEFDLPPR